MKVSFLVIIFIFAIQTQTVRQCNRYDFCDEDIHHYFFTINNKSSDRIYYVIYWNYPDTIIGDYNPSSWRPNILEPSDSVSKSIGRRMCWEYFFNDKEKEWIYFFDADKIENTSWQNVKDNYYGVLERRELSLEYLERNNWEVIIPR